MHEGCEADSTFDRGIRIRLAVAFAPSVVIASFEGAGEQVLQIDLVFDDLPGRSLLASLKKVAAAEFFRAEADCPSDLVHVAFERKQALRSAKAAKGPVWRDI